MLRITAERRSGGGTRLRLEGRVVGPWVAELARASDAARATGEPWDLAMAGVSFLDPEAVLLVRRLMRQGVVVSDCTEFVREQLRGGTDAPVHAL